MPIESLRSQSDRFTARATQDEVRRALEATNTERAQIGIPPLHPFAEFHPMPATDAQRLEEQEIIRRVAAEVGGWKRLATLVRNLAHFDGTEV